MKPRADTENELTQTLLLHSRFNSDGGSWRSRAARCGRGRRWRAAQPRARVGRGGAAGGIAWQPARRALARVALADAARPHARAASRRLPQATESTRYIHFIWIIDETTDNCWGIRALFHRDAIAPQPSCAASKMYTAL